MTEKSESIDLVKQYKENEAEIDRLTKIRAEEDERYEAEKNEIYEWYWRKDRALRDKKDNAESAIEKERKQLHGVVAERIEMLYQPIKQIKRTIVFLSMQAADITINDEEIKPQKTWRNDEYFEPLGALINDEFLNVQLYIVSTDKPKNKYTLCVVGKCAFPQSVLEWRWSFVSCLNIWRVNLQKEIRSAPTVEELKTYLEKRREHIIKECKQNYDEVKAEYLEVISTFTLDDFKDLQEEEG